MDEVDTNARRAEPVVREPRNPFQLSPPIEPRMPGTQTCIKKVASKL
jgi:hypothetical protein